MLHLSKNNIMFIKRTSYISISLTIFFLFLIRLIDIYLDSNPKFITVIPDDAFYYLQLAKNFSLYGKWTFDGETTTTGFHPLWAYLLTVFFSGGSSLFEFRTIFLIIGIFSSLLISFSIYIILIINENLFDKRSALISISPFLIYPALMQSTSLMEAPLVIFIAANLVYFIISDSTDRIKLLSLLLIGICGSLARSDFIVFLGFFCLSLLGLSLFDKNLYKINKFKILKASAAMLGSIIGLGLLILHNFAISEKLSQGSAEIKYFWSHVTGHNPIPAFKLLLSLAFPIPINIFIGLIIFLILLLILLIKFKKFSPLQIVFIISSVASIFSYLILLTFNSASIQSWYVSNLIIPLSFIFASLVFISTIKFRTSIVIAAMYLISGFYYSNMHVERQQVGMLNAAIYLKNNTLVDKVYGSWNAGIIGFFSHRTVINLDGLVNDNAIPYIKNNNLWDYIISNNIDFIVDYEEMFTNLPPWYLQKRGGHQDIRFHRCLKRGQVIDGGAIPWMSLPLRIYEVDKQCK
jgi:hypothetical protein